MAKEKSFLQLAGIIIHKENTQPLYQQIYQSLREAILTGNLRPGYRLPSSRAFATELGVSRNTVLIAFEQLAAEGYIQSGVGAGTFVSGSLPDYIFQDKLAKQAEIQPGPDLPTKAGKYDPQKGPVSEYRKKIIRVTPNYQSYEIKPFRHGIPAFDQFPFKIWEKISSGILRRLPISSLGYGDPGGYRPLREAVAEYLRTYRAVKCETEQVIIVNGSQQALDLAGRVLLDEDQTVIIEDPGYLGTRNAFASKKLNLFPVEVDQEGIKIEKINSCKKAGLVYVTPSHQYPLGMVMSISRRLQLLELAQKNNFLIFEDDYDSEFRYAGNPLPSLQGLDKNQRVIYTGSFSKVLFPALRLGYMVVPPGLTDAFTAVRSVTDRGSPITEQAVVAALIREGHFYRHIRRMRNLYRERQEILVSEINRELRELIKTEASDAGMHLVAWLKRNTSDTALSGFLAKQGIIAPNLSAYFLKQQAEPGLILGYTAYNEKQLKAGVRSLAKGLDLYFKSIRI